MTQTLSSGIPPRFIPDGPRNIWAYPRWRDPDYLLRKRLDTAIRGIAAEIPLHASVVDVGCGWMPYKEYFLARTGNLIGFDLDPYPGPEFRLMREKRWPVDTASADVCVSWQVLEHVDPLELYFSELRRVLKPGGTVYLTTHGHFRKHAEQDFWRWTRNGLEKAVAGQGLVDVSVTPIDTNLCTLAAFANNVVRLTLEEVFNLSPHRGNIAVGPVSLVTNGLCAVAELVAGAVAPRVQQIDPSLFLVKARVPGGSPR